MHFCCTSEDINNVSYALMLSDGVKVLDTKLREIINILKKMVKKYSNVAMLSHTHGQPASPTTMGKEFLVFQTRLIKLRNQLLKIDIECKMNGATGNYSAHNICFSNINWQSFTARFIKKLNLKQKKLQLKLKIMTIYKYSYDNATY